ncbi:hypothetical protein D9M69_655180 [compost metagenome]
MQSYFSRTNQRAINSNMNITPNFYSSNSCRKYTKIIYTNIVTDRDIPTLIIRRFIGEQYIFTNAVKTHLINFAEREKAHTKHSSQYPQFALAHHH